MTEILDILRLHHALILINVVLFVIITFVSWDILWWWSIGEWDEFGRVFFLFMIGLANGFACGAFYDWKKARDKTK